MVRANRANRKTVTRRTRGLDKINESPDEWVLIGEQSGSFVFEHVEDASRHITVRCPYGVAGDRLWTRESLGTLADGSWIYSADCQPVMVDPKDETAMIVWAHHKKQDYCTSMFMPRWASRDTLE